MKGILLIAEDPEILQSFTTMLSPVYTVYKAITHEEGLNALNNDHNNIAAVLIELSMALRNNYAFSDQMRTYSSFSTVPMLAVTRVFPTDKDTDCLEHGYYDLIPSASPQALVHKRIENAVRAKNPLPDTEPEQRDIVEKNRVLMRALARAEKASEAKTAFLSSMSHEIRTPLNAIIGLDKIALRDPNISENTRDDLEKIGSSARHLMSLINDILDMSRIESGRMELKHEAFSFQEFLNQISIIIQGQCDEKGLNFVCDKSELTDEYYIGDDLRLKQVLINILGNAVKFTDAPGTVMFYAEHEDDTDDICTLRFTIKDTGIGMDEAFLPKLFDAFSQEDGTAANRYGGSGLGMAITKNMVDLMGGRIEVDSEKGRGTTFTVHIPLRKADKADILPGMEHPGQELSLSGLHILIVEDMEMNAEILIDLLEMEEATASWAENGKIAIDLFNLSEAGHFDAILMDMRMPVMDGPAATRAIRLLDRPDAATIPIIALTANAFEEDVKICIEAGMNAHLSKPVDIDQLKELLGRILML